MMNILNGGNRHAESGVDFQEYMVVTAKGPSPFEPGPHPQVVVELFLDLRLPRPCRRPIAFTETLAASAIPPLDETRSQVIAPAIAANQFL